MLRTMIILLLVWIAVILLATGCATTDTYDEGVKYGAHCTTSIELRNDTKLEYPEDTDNLVRAEEGCVRHYGPDSCLVRFIKTGKLSYWAMCGGHK